MKALAGVLLAFVLAAGVSSQADAQYCMAKQSSKQVAKSVTHKKVASCSSNKSKRTCCICHVAQKSTRPNAKAGVIKTNTYGGFLPNIDSTLIGYRESIISQGQIRPKDPVNNGGSLNARMDGAGGLDPHTINNGMENTMSAGW